MSEVAIISCPIPSPIATLLAFWTDLLYLTIERNPFMHLHCISCGPTHGWMLNSAQGSSASSVVSTSCSVSVSEGNDSGIDASSSKSTSQGKETSDYGSVVPEEFGVFIISSGFPRLKGGRLQGTREVAEDASAKEAKSNRTGGTMDQVLMALSLLSKCCSNAQHFTVQENGRHETKGGRHRN